jgi:hypothetical protein
MRAVVLMALAIAAAVGVGEASQRLPGHTSGRAYQHFSGTPASGQNSAGRLASWPVPPDQDGPGLLR